MYRHNGASRNEVRRSNEHHTMRLVLARPCSGLAGEMANLVHARLPHPNIPAARSSSMSPPARLAHRRCACGGVAGIDAECSECRAKRLSRQRTSAVPAGGGERIPLQPQRIGFDDPIHGPLIESYRRGRGELPGGVDEFGDRVGLSDAQLKYSGILGVAGRVDWTPPVINQRNPADVMFHARPEVRVEGGSLSISSSTPAGLTTLFINDTEIHSNTDVERAIPRTPISSRREGNQAACWFSQGVNAVGRSTMDIFTPAPWSIEVTRAEAAGKYPVPACQAGGGTTRFRIQGIPSDAALETYIRDGEAEHDTDMRQAFESHIRLFATMVGNHVGDTPRTRITAPDAGHCEKRLRQIERRNDAFYDFALALNAATARRHAGGRHAVLPLPSTISPDCGEIRQPLEAGQL